MHRHILQKSSYYSDLASGFDSFKYTQIHDDPGNNETAKEFPAKATSFSNATGFLQKPVTGKMTVQIQKIIVFLNN